MSQQMTAPEPVVIGPVATKPSPHRAVASRLVNLLDLGGAFVAVWPLVAMVLAGSGIDPVALVGHVSGMVAGYGVLVMLVLMSRWPVLERGIGADVLARWHARGGRTVLTLVLAHAVFAVLAWSLLAGLDPVTALATVMTWPGLVAATIGTGLLVAVAVASARVARKKLCWETWYAVHLSTYVAVALSFVHQLAGPDLAGRPWLQAAWWLLYVWTFALVLRYRVLTPLQAAFHHRLRSSRSSPRRPGSSRSSSQDVTSTRRRNPASSSAGGS